MRMTLLRRCHDLVVRSAVKPDGYVCIRLSRLFGSSYLLRNRFQRPLSVTRSGPNSADHVPQYQSTYRI